MVVDVRVDNYRRPAQPTITEFGRFLGVGSRKTVIHWQLLQFRPANRTQAVSLVLGHASPEYKPYRQSAGIIAPITTTDAPAPADAKR